MHFLRFLTDRFLDREACLLLLNLVRVMFKMWGRRKRTRDLADRQTDTQTDRMIKEVGTLRDLEETDRQTYTCKERRQIDDVGTLQTCFWTGSLRVVHTELGRLKQTWIEWIL